MLTYFYSFDTAIGGFTYHNQFLQVATTLSDNAALYGLGENTHSTFRHDMTRKTWPMFARDQKPEHVSLEANN